MADVLHTPRSLVLYGTLGCHLCELAEQLLMPYVAAGWAVELVDIAEDDALLERFALMIPVLEDAATAQHLVWPFDESALKAFLLSASGAVTSGAITTGS